MKPFLLSLVTALALGGTALAQTPEFKLSPGDLVPGGDPAVTEDASDAPPQKGDLGAQSGETDVTAQERREQRLNLMFGRLAAADNKRRATRIARHIMRRLSRSSSATVDVLMTRANAAMKEKRYAVALDLLDGVVRMEPGFAEGWNRRATVHFLRGDYSASIADIEQVLRREPRHWGALSGLSIILVSLERKAEAVEIMDRALEVHPYLDEMKKRRERLVEELRGSDI